MTTAVAPCEAPPVEALELCVVVGAGALLVLVVMVGVLVVVGVLAAGAVAGLLLVVVTRALAAEATTVGL